MTVAMTNQLGRLHALPGLLGLLLVLASLAGPLGGAGEESAGLPGIKDWRSLHRIVTPAEGESPWRKIAWLTDVTEARTRARAEGKPLVIFTAADGSPLGRT